MSVSENRLEDRWNSNYLQFPRLLAEIAACVQFNKEELVSLCESMDITPGQLDELFDRAQGVWDNQIKPALREADKNPKRGLCQPFYTVVTKAGQMIGGNHETRRTAQAWLDLQGPKTDPKYEDIIVEMEMHVERWWND